MNNKRPTLTGFIDHATKTIRVWCPFCAIYHTHGVPDWPETVDYKRSEHRGAHCETEEGRKAFVGGYWIALQPPPKIAQNPFRDIFTTLHYRGLKPKES